MYLGVPVGLSVCVLSLSTNLFATLFVGYKAWYSFMQTEHDSPRMLTTSLRREQRRHLKGFLISGSQVEKLLILLMESGAAYCALWVSGLHYIAQPAYVHTRYFKH